MQDIKKEFEGVWGIDFGRLIASFMIVAIHIYPLATWSESLDYIVTRVMFRVAVPFFLMITGYFVLPSALQDFKKLVRYTKKILKIYILSILLYLPINLYNGAFTAISLSSFCKEIFFSGTFYHLWYFPALLLGLWLTYFVIQKLSKKGCFVLFLLLYLIGCFGDSYYGFVTSFHFIDSFYQFLFKIFGYTRNGIFYVPIFLYLGFSLAKKKWSFSCFRTIFFFFFFLLLMLFEGYILFSFKVPRHTSMYFFLLPVMYFLFPLFLSFKNNTQLKFRSLATGIYIWHPFFLLVIRLLSKKFNLDILLSHNFITYCSVLFLTVSFGYFSNCLLFKYKKN